MFGQKELEKQHRDSQSINQSTAMLVMGETSFVTTNPDDTINFAGIMGNKGTMHGLCSYRTPVTSTPPIQRR
jgi:hypothetical protein